MTQDDSARELSTLPGESSEVADDATTWQYRCAGCSDPVREGQRWCSRGCYAAENDDYEGAYG